MANPVTIKEVVPVTELTNDQKIAKQLVSDSDLLLKRIISGIDNGFILLWGNKDNPKTLEEAQAILDELDASDEAEVFNRHAKLVEFLATNGWASFEPWELKPAYTYTVDGNGRIQLTGDLVDEWTD